MLGPKRDSIHQSRSDTAYEADAVPPSHHGWIHQILRTLIMGSTIGIVIIYKDTIFKYLIDAKTRNVIFLFTTSL